MTPGDPRYSEERREPRFLLRVLSPRSEPQFAVLTTLRTAKDWTKASKTVFNRRRSMLPTSDTQRILPRRIVRRTFASLVFALSLVGCALAPAARVGSPGPLRAELPGGASADAPLTAGSAESEEPRPQRNEVATLKPSPSASRGTSRGTSKRPPAKSSSNRSPSRPSTSRTPHKAASVEGSSSTEPSASASDASSDENRREIAEASESRSSARVEITPPSFDVRGLSRDECAAFLKREGVAYDRAEGPERTALYVRPKGPIGGVVYEFDGRSAVHEVMDCRLVAALVQWGPRLRSLGIQKVRHISAYRPGARVARTGRPSGHASALALDLRYIELEDGRILDVLEDWGDRKKGAAPCEEGRGAGDPHPELRRLVCETIDDGIFQTIITPHRDTLHDNHVHLELVPEVEWTYVR